MNPLTSFIRVFGKRGSMTCREAEELMSPFIDSMAPEEEVPRLEAHVADCPPCRRQLQAYISVRNLMMSVEIAPVPPDLALKARVRLSRERYANFSGLRMRAYHAVRTVALPALAGACFTAVFFTGLLGTIGASSAIASNRPYGAETPSLYKRVRTTDPTMTRLIGQSVSLQEPLTVETHVDPNGRVVSYIVLSGPDDPDVDRWLKELLFFAEFKPATVFGRPVNSRLILSFVGVSS